MIRTLTSLAALALVSALAAGSAGAQSYPSKPVQIIVPLAAGTGMDTLVRLYGESSSRCWAARWWSRTGPARR